MVTKVKRSKKRSDLRSGFTTGACAAAASRAAVHALLTGRSPSFITITLPNLESATFAVSRLEHHAGAVLAGVIKDAGDDPDCTHDTEIQCFAQWSEQLGLTLDGGVGVARVTLPGLELPVGQPAINPVPRANILDMVQLEWNLNVDAKLITSPSQASTQQGIALEIRVPDGEERAKETIGPRLGLIGGISILGTRGTVKPYSTSAFSASVRQSVQIANANQQNHVVLTTGSRSEKSAMAMLPHLDSICFIQAGDFVGVGLRASKRYRVQTVTVVAMIGKLAKMVAGHMMTHVSGRAIDFQLLADLAVQSECSAELCQQISKANTGRHVLDLWRETSPQAFLDLLCQQAAEHAAVYVDHHVNIEFRLIDFDGSLLAKHYSPSHHTKNCYSSSEHNIVHRNIDQLSTLDPAP
ncbi:cobalt-precorrin-5B (C(1))-methyltransferase [Photobacterium sanguinicancri]|uniref:cobalt-precorrin-5B (C(1))-methyltransferase n=1 Tax=Photobacterium sanguinicancri TaxID=875932 RepID=UPI001EFC557E|nr:cobalt-precorrin-5B (C(1))-methyltransferase [Photobacterium sanguinicancri]